MGKKLVDKVLSETCASESVEGQWHVNSIYSGRWWFTIAPLKAEIELVGGAYKWTVTSDPYGKILQSGEEDTLEAAKDAAEEAFTEEGVNVD